MTKLAKIQHITDANQTFWQLAIIQVAPMFSIPILVSMVMLLQGNSLMSALISVFIGNMLLWGIRYVIMAMSFEGRKSTLDITYDYFGKIGAFFIAFIILMDTLAWFLAQTTLASNSLIQVLPFRDHPDINHFMQVSIVLGVLSTLFCMEGMIALRWLTILSFPLLVIAFIGLAVTAPPITLDFSFSHFSFSGIGLLLAANLGITADLPTFFRHSHSWKDSCWALTILQVSSLVIGIVALFLSLVFITPIETSLGSLATSPVSGILPSLSLGALVFVAVICANVANVYSSSVGWELLAPAALVGRKEYMILGLSLSIIFIIIAGIFSVELLLDLADCSLVNLCIVLVIGYLLKQWTQKTVRTYDHAIYFVSWLLATIVNILQYLPLHVLPYTPLLTSLAIILILIGFGLLIKNVFKLNSN